MTNLKGDNSPGKELLDRLEELSFVSMGYSSPNPPVACIATGLDGKIIAASYTGKTGSAHAERYLYQHYPLTEPHNLYVTLQPCTHFGKTPPCIDLILEKKPVNVYAGISDPNPLVEQSVTRYAEKGINFEYNSRVQLIAETMMAGFLKRMKKQQPLIILKSAVSSEGYFADITGKTVRLSGPATDRITMLLRAKVDGILAGPGTIVHDCPALHFRNLETEADSNFQIPEINHIFFKNLVKSAFAEELIRHHNRHNDDYQPYRLFLVGDESDGLDSWIQKQAGINDRLHSKKTVIFLSGNRNKKEYSEELINKLRSITALDLQFIKHDPALEILEFAGKLGINQLLVEGGNLLYSSFYQKMGEEDYILKIETAKSITKGIKPDIPEDRLLLIDSFRIENDLWKVYRKCLQD